MRFSILDTVAFCRKRRALLLSLFPLLLLYACSSPGSFRKPHAFKVSQTVVARDIDAQGTDVKPLKPSSKFANTDDKVVSYVKLNYISGTHRIRWDWLRPDGEVYLTTGYHPIDSTAGTYREKIYAWHRMYIKNEQAASYPGKWKVQIYLDNDVIASNAFQIEDAGPPAVLMHKRHAYAVIIGISAYQHSGKDGFCSLAFADDDARDFRDALLHMGWSESHIKLLINQEATRNSILVALESWLSKAGSDDLIVLFWSGHGFADPENPEKVYFACYDSNPNIPATGYRMDRVRSAIEEHRAKNVVILADTCHAGKIVTRGDRGIAVAPYVEKLKRERDVPKGWIFMVGADTDRLAIEHTAWSNGAFTHVMLKGLSGEADGYESIGPHDGVITMSELRAYMEAVMPDQTQRVLGAAKHPLITTSSGDPDIWNLCLKPQ
jgi:hypothetical protein